MAEEYLTVEQARLRLGGISHTKMSELIKTGVLPTQENIADKRSRLILASDVDGLIAKGFKPRAKRSKPEQAAQAPARKSRTQAKKEATA